MGKILFHPVHAIIALSVILLGGCQDSVATAEVYVPGQTTEINGELEMVTKELPAPVRTEEEYRRDVEAIFTSYIGVREATGKNDGPEVKKFLASVGLKEGFAWCAAFAHCVFDEAGIETTITAWSPTAENKSNFVYRNKKLLKPPQSADVFTLYYPSKKRIGHTGFVYKINNTMITTVEGNTNSGKSREGDGVYVLFRPLGTIHSISSWIPTN